MLGGRWEALGGFAVFCKSGGHKIFPTKKKFFFLHMSAPKMQIKPEF